MQERRANPFCLPASMEKISDKFNHDESHTFQDWDRTNTLPKTGGKQESPMWQIRELNKRSYTYTQKSSDYGSTLLGGNWIAWMLRIQTSRRPEFRVFTGGGANSAAPPGATVPSDSVNIPETGSMR